MVRRPQEFTSVRGYGTFRDGANHWSSHQARITFRQVGSGNRISAVVARVWGQRGVSSTSDTYVTPHFTAEEIKRMRAKAKERFQDRADGNEPPRRGGGGPDKNHREDLCERCEHLGKNCSG